MYLDILLELTYWVRREIAEDLPRDTNVISSFWMQLYVTCMKRFINYRNHTTIDTNRSGSFEISEKLEMKPKIIDWFLILINISHQESCWCMKMKIETRSSSNPPIIIGLFYEARS